MFRASQGLLAALQLIRNVLCAARGSVMPAQDAHAMTDTLVCDISRESVAASMPVPGAPEAQTRLIPLHRQAIRVPTASLQPSGQSLAASQCYGGRLQLQPPNAMAAACSLPTPWPPTPGQLLPEATSCNRAAVAPVELQRGHVDGRCELSSSAASPLARPAATSCNRAAVAPVELQRGHVDGSAKHARCN